MSNKFTGFSYLLPSSALLGLVIISLIIITSKSGSPYPEHWLAQWKMGQAFSIPRRALAAVASNTHLYAIGGVDSQGRYVKKVEYAKFGENGDIGPWSTTSELNEGRFYLAAVIVGKHLFVLGGGYGPIGGDNKPISSVERAVINADGSLDAWETVSHMQLPRRGLKAIAVGHRIYAIGGYSGVFLKSTEHVSVDEHGNLGNWKIDPQQARLDRYIHSASYFDDHIYLLGGHVQQSDQISYGTVESTVINDLGYLKPWEIEPSKLLQARFIATSFALNNRLYILGGHNGAKRLKSVEFTKILRNGRVSSWSNTTALNIPRSAAASAVSGNFVYVLGGMSDSQALNSVEFATAAKNGQLGQIAKLD